MEKKTIGLINSEKTDIKDLISINKFFSSSKFQNSKSLSYKFYKPISKLFTYE